MAFAFSRLPTFFASPKRGLLFYLAGASLGSEGMNLDIPRKPWGMVLGAFQFSFPEPPVCSHPRNGNPRLLVDPDGAFGRFSEISLGLGPESTAGELQDQVLATCPEPESGASKRGGGLGFLAVSSKTTFLNFVAQWVASFFQLSFG